jgi:hypothetical protein
MKFPTIESRLPDLMSFVSVLAQAYRSGAIDSWEAMGKRVHAFFSPQELAKVEAIAPGDMARDTGGVTLAHVMAAFVFLFFCPEFQQASKTQQELLKWIVLFHDIGKRLPKNRKDLTHGFKSAAMTGKSLPQIGFATTSVYTSLIEDWVALVNAATTTKSGIQDYIQDNRKLPAIIYGIEKLYGHNTPAALIVKTVLLHMSIDVVKDWPSPAPLTDAEIKTCVDLELFPLLKVMMLVDNDAWAFLDRPTREKYRRETLNEFERLESFIGA